MENYLLQDLLEDDQDDFDILLHTTSGPNIFNEEGVIEELSLRCLREFAATNSDETFIESSKTVHNVKRKKRRINSVPEKIHPMDLKIAKRVKNPFGHFSDDEFFRELRVTKDTFEKILEMIHGVDIFRTDYSGGNFPLQPQTALQLFLYYMGHMTSSFRALGAKFDISDSTARVYFMKCVEALNKLEEICWPSSKESVENEQKFRNISGFPGIVGSIGGCCLDIKTRIQAPAGYKINKRKSIMWLLGVVNSEKDFLYVHVGFPGSFSLQEALDSSTLGKTIKENPSELFTNSDFYLVSNAELQQSKHIMTSFDSKSTLTQAQQKYNKMLQQSCNVDEALVALKVRFPLLQKFIYAQLEKIPSIIKAAVTVYNIAGGDQSDSKYMEKLVTDCKLEDYFRYRDSSRDEVAYEADEIGLQKRDSVVELLATLPEVT